MRASPNHVDQKWRQDEILANYTKKFSFLFFPLRYQNLAPSNFIHFHTSWTQPSKGKIFNCIWFTHQLMHRYTWTAPKLMRMIFFFCAAQKGQERKVLVVVDGERTQVYSLTYLSWDHAFVAVGTLAKCVVVFVSCQGRKCRWFWSSFTLSSSAAKLE